MPVETRLIPLDQLKARVSKTEEITSTEASLRLDAVASAAFRVSRSKMTDLVKAGDVRVNWREATKASLELKEGDVVACTGKGRFEVKSIELTKKEKYFLTLMRFV